ncbi:3'-5' exoribonuclease [Streptomyces sp. ME02-6978a]|uniref:3'-5' exoribonuclease domain-containing protein n=1 Tax=unclassified Streptomyces TaxID=2593676 RepID=UPI0029A9B23D|nr:MULTISPECIES: 3'-5' exoribonuclease [unclassified Streptomyces]MDX3087202.1 3'-5' exoribonuclease [Streptomyces sp. ME12-02E]MDX3335844.1 3'-5' exoribonuclease [Streptomyces sp. ME02-6978a]
MVAIDYDLEFLEDGRTIELISIGMVCDDGREYYAVNRDMPVRRIRKHKWLMENVVPSLPKGQGDMRNSMSKRWLFHYGDPRVKSRSVIADEVMDFIRAAGPDVELWANYGAYDHVCLAQLWGRMIDLPEGVPMFTRDIQQERARLGLRWDELPQQESGEHNALADARHNQTVRRWLAGQEARTS